MDHFFTPSEPFFPTIFTPQHFSLTNFAALEHGVGFRNVTEVLSSELPLPQTYSISSLTHLPCISGTLKRTNPSANGILSALVTLFHSLEHFIGGFSRIKGTFSQEHLDKFDRGKSLRNNSSGMLEGRVCCCCARIGVEFPCAEGNLAAHGVGA